MLKSKKLTAEEVKTRIARVLEEIGSKDDKAGAKLAGVIADADKGDFENAPSWMPMAMAPHSTYIAKTNTMLPDVAKATIAHIGKSHANAVPKGKMWIAPDGKWAIARNAHGVYAFALTEKVKESAGMIDKPTAAAKTNRASADDGNDLASVLAGMAKTLKALDKRISALED